MSKHQIRVAVLVALILAALTASRARAQAIVIVRPSPLQGAAAAIEAQGRFEIDRQRARLLAEQVRQERLRTRRLEIEQRMWERDHLPTLTDDLERARRYQVAQAQKNPPLTEVLSGKSLNDLLQDCRILQGQGFIGPNIPLDEDLVRKLNVVTGNTAGNHGLLRARRLPWPLLLAGAPFDGDRRLIEALLARAVREANSGLVRADTVEELLRALAALERKVGTMARGAADRDEASKQVRAARFLGELRSTVQLLQEPDAPGLVAGRYPARGKTMAELIRHMTDEGLRFAPATPGNGAGYVVVHRGLASYDAALQAAAGVTLPDRSETLNPWGR
jgi:hypothetical protein